MKIILTRNQINCILIFYAFALVWLFNMNHK